MHRHRRYDVMCKGSIEELRRRQVSAIVSSGFYSSSNRDRTENRDTGRVKSSGSFYGVIDLFSICVNKKGQYVMCLMYNKYNKPSIYLSIYNRKKFPWHFETYFSSYELEATKGEFLHVISSFSTTTQVFP
jgi:hypothetical protein